MNQPQDTAASPVMQLAQERSRLTVDGRRTDDDTRCTLLAVNKINKVWELYPHGMAQFGVRLTQPEAVKLAQAILAADVR